MDLFEPWGVIYIQLYCRLYADIFNGSRITLAFQFTLLPYGMTGFFERIVRIIKSKLWKKLKNLTLTYKELHTLLFEIERIVKNRPVT